MGDVQCVLLSLALLRVIYICLSLLHCRYFILSPQNIKPFLLHSFADLPQRTLTCRENSFEHLCHSGARWLSSLFQRRLTKWGTSKTVRDLMQKSVPPPDFIFTARLTWPSLKHRPAHLSVILLMQCFWPWSHIFLVLRGYLALTGKLGEVHWRTKKKNVFFLLLFNFLVCNHSAKQVDSSPTCPQQSTR